jgi:hypothetical protein
LECCKFDVDFGAKTSTAKQEDIPGSGKASYQPIQLVQKAKATNTLRLPSHPESLANAIPNTY